ncbi:hypothetical protein [Candidatus Ichthyocystis sparus]|nr:hypothetical protein [Candidatus Ichthyocystis sparus]
MAILLSQLSRSCTNFFVLILVFMWIFRAMFVGSNCCIRGYSYCGFSILCGVAQCFVDITAFALAIVLSYAIVVALIAR